MNDKKELDEEAESSLDSPTSKHTGGSSKINESRDIFRKAMIESATERYGSPVHLLGISSWVLTLFFMSFLACALTILCTTRYARKETVSGQVFPIEGALRITSQYAGIAEKVMIRDGDVVNAGSELFFISSRPTLESGASLEDSLRTIQLAQQQAQEAQSNARMRQIQSQIAELMSKRDGVAADISAIDNSLKILARRRVLQAETLLAYKSLEGHGMVASTMVRQYEDTLLGIDQQTEDLTRTKIRQKNEYDQTRPRLEGLNAELEQSRSEALSSAAQSHEKRLNSDAQFSRRLVAPMPGVVTAMQIHQGSLVSVGETLAILVPKVSSTNKSHLEVELWAPSKSIGFVKSGAKVRLMYDAFPHETFGIGKGVVRSIAGAPAVATDFTTDSKEQLFRIVVTIEESSLTAYGRQWPLVPGMRLTADIILEDQSLLDWVIAPIHAIRNRT